MHSHLAELFFAATGQAAISLRKTEKHPRYAPEGVSSKQKHLAEMGIPAHASVGTGVPGCPRDAFAPSFTMTAKSLQMQKITEFFCCEVCGNIV